LSAGSAVPFVKMQGLGNDFVVFDATGTPVNLDAAQARWIADRRLGIGCDQILMLEAPREAGTDFFYRVFNADGSEVAQCGNGARCVARLAVERGMLPEGRVRLGTTQGLLEAEVLDHRVRVNMGVPRFAAADIPADFSGDAMLQSLEIDGEAHEFGLVNIGNPHAVIRVAAAAAAPVARLGPVFNTHPAFPDGVNLGFMQVEAPDRIRLRVYERGAGETPACGSGACAAVVHGRRLGWLDERVIAELQGGELVISWKKAGAPVWMEGPAETVFEGHIRL
jgi:diaminopimelate epimerase